MNTSEVEVRSANERRLSQLQVANLIGSGIESRNKRPGIWLRIYQLL